MHAARLSFPQKAGVRHTVSNDPEIAVIHNDGILEERMESRASTWW